MRKSDKTKRSTQADEETENTAERYYKSAFWYGIIYSNAEDAYVKLKEIKKVLEKENKENKEPTAEFVKTFVEKYQLELPQDIFFWCIDIIWFVS